MKKIILPILLLAIASIAANAQNFTPEQKLRYSEQLIERFYVDKVNADSIVEEGIKAMLKTLDPHSVYSTPEETKELTEPLQGNFSGIGIQFNMLNDTLYVIQTIAGGPSEQVGIIAGDRIISANDTLISGANKQNKDIQAVLRGPKGSVVNVKVKRGSNPELIDFRIVRDDIPIYSVDAAYMADPTTGYIRISRFAEDTANEVLKAMSDLKRQGMKNLIIDLEYNGGGYLRPSADIANMFLDKGDMIVYTDGINTEPAYFKADRNGIFKDGRVVVMVNQYSATASEILSGALQDNDRGAVVGRRTFGKGLVQRPFPFPDGSMIRLTTARYHTPSGRCIQKPYGDNEDDYNRDMLTRYERGEYSNADSIHLDKSLLYHTLKSRRPVYGGGGIMPDVFVPIDTAFYSDYYRDLTAKGALNRAAITYVDNNRSTLKRQYPRIDAFIKGFEVPQSLMQSVIDLGEKEGVKFNEEQYATSGEYMRTIVKALVARDLFDMGGYYRIVNDTNPVYREALELVNDPTRYQKLLTGQN